MTPRQRVDAILQHSDVLVLRTTTYGSCRCTPVGVVLEAYAGITAAEWDDTPWEMIDDVPILAPIGRPVTRTDESEQE